MRAGARPSETDLLVDASVAVALLVADHEHHQAVSEGIGARQLGLAGHAAFETFSVLTRLPPPARRRPAVVERLLSAGSPATRFLGADDASRGVAARRLGPQSPVEGRQESGREADVAEPGCDACGLAIDRAQRVTPNVLEQSERDLAVPALAPPADDAALPPDRRTCVAVRVEQGRAVGP